MAEATHERLTYRGEERLLRRAWEVHAREHLDSYLVSGVEDPRINFQSILTRALIGDTLFPGRFDTLIDAEWRFGLCVTWLLENVRESGWDLLEALESGDESRCPAFLIDTYRGLQREDCPLPDYVSSALMDCQPPAPFFSTFMHAWVDALARCPQRSMPLLEVGCGSVNDYRFIASYGLGRFLRYTGLDICAQNIANARRRFPQVSFMQGSVLNMPFKDGAFDYLFAHDVFEHLSPKAFEQALREVVRVTKKQAWLSFFAMSDIPQHEFLDLGKYHLNRLSIARTVELLHQRGCEVDVVDVPQLASAKFGCREYYNPNARTLIITV